jgi:transcription elongation factor Elf1
MGKYEQLLECPKCKSRNVKKAVDYSDSYHDLCLVCGDCGYSEIEQKRKMNN